MRHLIGILSLAASAASFGAGQADYRFIAPLGIDLRSDDLEKVQSILGAAPVTWKDKHFGYVCYLWPNAKVITTGYDGFGGIFELAELEAPAPAECRGVSEAGARIPLAIQGLSLGMNEQQFLSIVGGKPQLKDGRQVITFEWTEPFRNKDGEVVGELVPSMRIEGGFSDHRLTSLRIVFSGGT